MARTSGGRSALSRVVDVLDAFAVDAPTLTLSDIAERAQLPLSSCHRIVAELVSHGFLERVHERRYRIGARLWELGTRTPGVLGLRELAVPFLHGVQSHVRQHVQLVVQAGLDALVIERLSARTAVLNASIIGGRTPLELSSGGLVLIAFGDPRLVDDVIARGLADGSGGAARTPAELRERVELVRAEGYAVTAGYIVPESRGVAVPIRGSERNVVGALSVVVGNDDSPIDDYVRILRVAAAGISEELLRSYLPPHHPGARRGGGFRQLVNSSERSMVYFEQQR